MKTRAEHKGIYLKLNTVTDKDVIDRLDSQENKQGYLKDLVRTDASLDSLRHSFGTLTQVKEKEG
jgi:hypothetical protein